jgi:NAD(P)-dependent dehydrogenase (short-subunit alcohol dehydrogenase family)
MTMVRKPVCAVVGVGPGNGAAIARRFARENHAVALLARGPGLIDSLAGELEDSRPYPCDVTVPAAIDRAFAAIRADLGDPEIVVYNAGSGVWGDVTQISRDDFEKSWRVNAAGALDTAHAVLPAMRKAGRGAIIFVGATASLRGGAVSAAFSAAKAAQRSLAQSMARRLWPEGIHVALLVIDGVVDLPRTRERMPDKPDSFFLQPDEVATAVYQLSQQAPSAWSFEVDVRPFGEKW